VSATDKAFGQTGLTSMRLKVHCEAFQGLADIQGMLHFDGANVRLDFQTADALFGMLRSGPKQIEVPLTAIEGVRCGAGWFWLMPYIEIELNDFNLLTQVPGAKDGRWRLGVRWRDRQALRRFAAALAFARSGALHAQLNVGIEPGSAVQALPETPLADSSQRSPRQFEK